RVWRGPVADRGGGVLPRLQLGGDASLRPPRAGDRRARGVLRGRIARTTAWSGLARGPVRRVRGDRGGAGADRADVPDRGRRVAAVCGLGAADAALGVAVTLDRELGAVAGGGQPRPHAGAVAVGVVGLSRHAFQ